MGGPDPVDARAAPPGSGPGVGAGLDRPAASAREQRAALEATLVERARAGRAEAWARLYEICFHEALREATYLLGNLSEAEDLVHEAFAVALAKIHTFEGRAGFGGWLRGILLNLARKTYRARGRRRRALERLREVRSRLAPPAGADVESDHLAKRRAEALLAVLETLPPVLREAFVLVDLRGVPPKEAAGLLGVRPGTLRVRASRARRRVRDGLAGLGWDVGGAS